MAFAWLIAWVIDAGLFALTFLVQRFVPGVLVDLIGVVQAVALRAATVLIVISVPWILLTVVVSFLEMRRATRKAGKED